MDKNGGIDSTESAENVYETRAIAFLDILGFSDVILSGGAEAQIAELFEALKIRAAQVERASSSGRMQLSVFSDSIVVSEEYLDGFGADRIAGYVSFLASDILARGFLVRGGLSIGKLHHRDGTVFGPALIEAYHLESKIALFPRIVVTKEFQETVLKSALKEHTGLARQHGIARAMSMFRTDFDGVMHLDILGHFAAQSSNYLELSGLYSKSEPGGSTTVTLDMLAEAARNAVHKTRTLRYKDGAKQKYDWMDRYLAESAIRQGWPPPRAN